MQGQVWGRNPREGGGKGRWRNPEQNDLAQVQPGFVGKVSFLQSEWEDSETRELLFPPLGGKPCRENKVGGGPRASPRDLGALLRFQEISLNLPSKPTEGVRQPQETP